MNRVLEFLLFLLMVVLAGLGCSDNSIGSGDDGGTDPAGGTAGNVTMTIAGAAWSSDVSVASLVVASDTIYAMVVSGTSTRNATTFAFVVGSNSGIGTHTYTYSGNPDPEFAATYYVIQDTTRNASFVPRQGAQATVAISEINRADNTVSGTFSFDLIRDDGSGGVEVRNGTFTRIPLSAGVPAFDVPGGRFAKGMDAQHKTEAAARAAFEAR